MVLVLQRRVLVMGPRIILRGAIPIDSNIGGSGHRPLFGRGGVSWLFCVVVCHSAFVCRVVLWCRVALKFSCKVLLETCNFLGPRYYRGLSRYYRVERAWYYRSVERYYHSGAVLPPSGTTAMTHDTTAPSSGRGGYDSGRGVPTPHTHSCVSLSTSLSLKNGAGGPRWISVSGHSPRIPTGGIVPHHFLLPWNKVFPQIPLFLGCSLASRFLGICLLFLRF